VIGSPSTDNLHIYRTVGIGCLAEILVTDLDSLVKAIAILHDELERIDRAASRFRADSELASVHRAEGRPVIVSPCLFEAVSVALRVAEVTDGTVDPTVGNAMTRLGYDRDFAEIAGGVAGSLPEKSSVAGWQSIELNHANRTLRVPLGTLIDLGASAKALTADRIARRVSTTLGCGVLVSLGGDISVGGPPPTEGFRVGLADVSGAAEACETVAITSGGLATSGIMSRRWRLGHHTVHHIVDPSTGLSATAAWRTVTVTAASCVDANAASTAAMVKGATAEQWLESIHLPSRLVAVDGRILRVAGWPTGDTVMQELAQSSR
jgi:thiamine biosynthesis lipoprotein